ncbi:MAG: hypothetical protein PHG65_12510 [Kiritimatiellae bacterium]|nr:hypothetical protein [Kiritimatiellia bacterium]
MKNPLILSFWRVFGHFRLFFGCFGIKIQRFGRFLVGCQRIPPCFCRRLHSLLSSFGGKQHIGRRPLASAEKEPYKSFGHRDLLLHRSTTCCSVNVINGEEAAIRREFYG